MPADYTPPAWLVALLALPPVARANECVRGRPSRECNCTWCCRHMRDGARENLMSEWDHDAASLPHEEDRR